MSIVNRRLTLVVSVLLFALPLIAGHDIASIRYAPFVASRDASYQPAPMVAASGSRFLTLWGAQNFWSYNNRIYGSRSDASSGSNSPAFAAVPYYYYPTGYIEAFAGTASGYVAIWDDWVDPLSGPSFGRFTSEGVLERRANLGPAMRPFYRAVLASNGNRIAMVHSDGIWIWISIMDLDGNLIRSTHLMTYGDTYAVAAMGSDFAVVTAGYDGIIQWLVSNDGTLHQAAGRILPPPLAYAPYAIATAAKNGHLVTAWTQLGSQYPYTTFPSGTLASATIQPDGSITQNLLPTSGAPPSSAPAVLPVDGGYVIAWNVTPPSPANPRIVAVRLDENGTPLDDHPLFVADGRFTGAASSGNTLKFALTTSSPASFGVATLTATVDAAGISAQPAAAVLAQVPHLTPVITGNGAGFTAAWREVDARESRVVAGRLSPAGEPLDGTGIVLDSHAAYAPVIAHGRSEDLIVWMATDGLKARRLSVSGGVLDATPITVADHYYDAPYDVVWNGSRFFVAWVGQATFYYAFVGPDGLATPVRGFSLPSFAPFMYPQSVSVAWDGRQYIVVYEHVAPSVSEDWAGGQTRVMRVSAGGVLLDPIPALVENFRDGHFQVASSGSESIIVLDRDSGPGAIVVRDQGDTLHLDPEVPLLHWESGMSGVRWNGSAYVVAAHYAPTPYYVYEPSWLSAIEVSQSGRPLRIATAPAMGPLSGGDLSAPSIAIDVAAGTAFVTTEITGQTGVPRGRIRLSSEFSPATVPTPPPAPRNVVSYSSGTTLRIDWQSDGGADGFVVDRSSDFGRTWWSHAALPPEARTITVDVSYPRVGEFIRVRSYGPGGMSEGSIIAIGGMSGRRPGRR